MAERTTDLNPSAENTGEFTASDWVMFFGVSLIWGSSFLLIAFALEDLTPGMITLGRVSLGAVVLWILRIFTSPGNAIEKADQARVVVLSVLWVALPFTLFPLAQENINSAVTGLLNGAVPVFAAIVSTIFLKARPRGTQLLGISIGSIGIALISFFSGGEGSSELQGVLLVLAATVCYGVSVNIAAPLQRKYGAVVLMSAVLGLATIWVIPFGFVDFDQNSLTFGAASSVLFLGAMGTGVAYWIMATLVGRIGSIRATFITYLMPAISLALGVLIRDDVVKAGAIAGAALAVVGAFLASRRESATSK